MEAPYLLDYTRLCKKNCRSLVLYSVGIFLKEKKKKKEKWYLFNANGIAVLKGNGNVIRLNQIRSGFYLIHFGQNVFQIRLGK